MLKIRQPLYRLHNMSANGAELYEGRTESSYYM